MAKQYGQKLKILVILDILRKYSDEENPICATDICEKLSEYGISAERKSVYTDIAELCDYGYDIIKCKKGYFLASREFEEPEIHLLCDAVRTANFITAKKTTELVNKLSSMLSVNQASRLEKGIYFDSESKCTNEQIYYTIHKICEAISNKKQMEVEYGVRKLTQNRSIEYTTKKMVINPYALTWQDDHYYLICNHSKYNNLMHLRLDRIYSSELLETKARYFGEVSEYTDYFNIADYTKKLFGMHGGSEIEIELRCSEKIIEPIIDRFSERIFIKNVADGEFSFTAKAVLSEALVTFIINFGENIRVEKPQILRDMVKERAEKVYKIYKNV